MFNSSVAFVILIIASVWAQSSASDAEAWRHNLKTASQFTCKDPQPRAVLSETLLKGQIGTAEIIVPAFTVLHRCDEQSGCCLFNNQICSANGTERVTLTFKIAGISNNKYYKTVTAYNHTRCGCVSRNEQPKRFHWLEGIPVQLEIASGQSTQNGYNLILLGCVVCLLFITIFIYII